LKKEGKSMSEKGREGVLVSPHYRLSDTQVRLVDEVSRDLLQDPGLLCYNAQAVEFFKRAGAKVESAGDCMRLRIPSAVINKALDTRPSRIVLGARNPDNRLILDAYEPRARFGSGSETNIWLEVEFDGSVPKFIPRDGSIELLGLAAHLCENLEHLDFFIRCVNIRDREVTEGNKDVNKFLVSLNNITKHVQAGLTSLSALDDVIKMAEIIAGGKDAFEKNPVISFITCLIKSPLQMVDDTTSTLIEVSKRRVPVVISSSPMGGTTAPFDEFGMVAQINAEILAGVVLNQLVAPGSPVLYGSVPVRCRLDDLNDMYGAPEFVHYNVDCAQMARFYGLPCYSTAGVGDAEVPGIQATVEKLMTLFSVPWSGAQYIHYAFGLLERTNTFCPEQAVMDDTHIGIVKRMLSPPDVSEKRSGSVRSMIQEVMNSDRKMYIYHLPLPTRDPVYVRYPLEDPADALYAAHRRYQEIKALARKPLPGDIREEILAKIPGVLSRTLES
jgi:trimethylamine--corrinoid protein Co-methyltransferase